MKIKILVILVVLLLCTNFLPTSIAGFNKKTYNVRTEDGFRITLTRYTGNKRPSIMLVHGMGVNHKIFDWDNNHSFARFLNNDGWDVWMLDLRTHDGDGDFLFRIGSDREYINRNWDFDNTLLKLDVVKAVDFIKEKSGEDKIFFMGHSYGGYLAYAYAEMIGEENLSGIITTGSSGYGHYANLPFIKYLKFGIKIGNRVFVNPIGLSRNHFSYSEIQSMYETFSKSNGIFFSDTTPKYIKEEFLYCCDDEPAGVVVDVFFGKHPRLYKDHWIDPQTLYDYTDNLDKITVPFLAVAGDEDTDDPMDDVLKTYNKVSSQNKLFLHYKNHGHLDLLLGDYCDILIFPEIINWMSSIRASSDLFTNA